MSVLSVVGTGIELIVQLTPQARHEIVAAEKVFYLVADEASSSFIRELNPNAVSLHNHYSLQMDRNVSYSNMVKDVMSALEAGHNVCLVSYGHPGVFAFPMHESIRQARQRGFSAKMYPAISCEDALYADLGIDPGFRGCQTFEATDFLVFERRHDVRSHLVLLQIGVIGVLGFPKEIPNRTGLKVLVERLSIEYGEAHKVVIYEAAPFLVSEPVMTSVTLAQLMQADISAISTLYVPPIDENSINVAVANLLGLV